MDVSRLGLYAGVIGMMDLGFVATRRNIG